MQFASQWQPQGHIKPMLRQARLPHSHGYVITFFLTEFDHNRLRRSNRRPRKISSSRPYRMASHRFMTITAANRDVPSLCESLGKIGTVPFRDLVMRLQRPKVSLVFGDGLLCFAQEVAAELGGADVMFWTASACSFDGLSPLSSS